ncbi:unnamed protein product [Vicia faba]|uniref:Uncharacterized protein n=1 Tax=Vicia faba TaxID=3906 RepID=A0AAV1AZB2_VICFA|nr:unnamed protein product [Vicia faba]
MFCSIPFWYNNNSPVLISRWQANLGAFLAVSVQYQAFPKNFGSMQIEDPAEKTVVLVFELQETKHAPALFEQRREGCPGLEDFSSEVFGGICGFIFGKFCIERIRTMTLQALRTNLSMAVIAGLP